MNNLNKSSISFFNHVNRRINPYKWVLSIVVSFIISLVFGALFLNVQIQSEKQTLSILSSYLKGLSQSNDRPEMQRVLKSVGDVNNSELVLVENGIVLSHSNNIQLLDLPYHVPLQSFQILDLSIILPARKMITSKEIRNGLSLYMFKPLDQFLYSTLTFFLFSLILLIIISFISSRLVANAVKRTLAPLEQLHREIRNLSNIQHSIIPNLKNENASIKISELEDIRLTVLKTRIDLENALSIISDIKAKKISTESYKQLIHDLHNPVAALKVMTKNLQDNTLTIEDKNVSISGITRITDQILNQVTSAKRNLENDVQLISSADLSQCINETIQELKLINKSSKILNLKLSNESLFFPHDPILLKRAIHNLLENALEYSVSVVELIASKFQDKILIQIIDDGPGMKESFIPIYFQGRGFSSKADRSAYGLASTNHIVRNHGGKLIYKRGQNGGSIFEIRLEILI